MGERAPKLLILSQVYVPDPASVGQHLSDVAAEMARRGHPVQVLTSARGYEDPSRRYPRREIRDGVHIRRLPLASFGKRSIARRLLGALAFLIQATMVGLGTRRLAHVLVSTSPPMATIAALVIATLRRVPITFWVMDVNPDQAVVMGAVFERSLPARLLEALNRVVLARARDVVVLDRFMAERVRRKADVGERLVISPPWPHLEPSSSSGAPELRQRWGLDDELVVMHSGNHSPAHPLEAVLEAARKLEHRDDIVFLFVGGGLAKREVEAAIEAGARNVRSLPYQPLELLSQSLAVADVHLVPFGAPLVGIVHPCKVYGAMAAQRPVLLIGPEACHVGELIRDHEIGWQIPPDGEEIARLVARLAGGDRATLKEMGRRAGRAIRNGYSRELLCGRFCDVLEGRQIDPLSPPGGAQELVASRHTP